jgi:hypothetical protein
MKHKEAQWQAHLLANKTGEAVMLYKNCDGKWSFCTTSQAAAFHIKRPAAEMITPGAKRPCVRRPAATAELTS